MTTGQDMDGPEELTAAHFEDEVASPEVEVGDGTGRPGLLRRIGRWCKAGWAPLVAGVVLVGAAALTATTYWYQYRPDQQTDKAVGQAAKQAATDGTVALLSYSPGTLDHDFSAAKTHLTGDFLSYYNQFTEQIVAPAAKQKGVKTTAAVVQSAVSELHPDSAVVLLFLNQSTTSTEKPNPALTSSSVLVTLTKVHGTWLISKFDPV